jgi:hypothetical protein
MRENIWLLVFWGCWVPFKLSGLLGIQSLQGKGPVMPFPGHQLGMVLKGQTFSLYSKQIDPILHYPLPQTMRQLRAFMRVKQFCRIWILGYPALARPLHQLLSDDQQNFQSLIEWDPKSLKAPNGPSIESAHSKSLPVLCLYKGGNGPWSTIPTRSPTPQPVGYLSKEIDNAAKRWSRMSNP